MKIAIDAGHGLYTAGKRCLKSIDPKEMREWVLNARIAEKVIAGLRDYDCEPLRIDDPTGQTDVSLTSRCNKANNAGCDFYVSIHHNAGINGGSGGGIVVYTYLGAKASTKAVAQAVYDAAVARTGLKGNRSAGVAEANFQVLRNTTMSAILGEFGFMDSTADVPIILTDTFAENCAAGIVAGLAAGLGLKQIAVTTAESEEDEVKIYNKVEEIPDWAQPTIRKLVAKGVLLGGGTGGLYLTEAQMRLFVVHDRLGLYGE